MSDVKKLYYEIFKFSSYSTSYLPENIRENCPSNQTSRWSSNTNTPPQFLILKLKRPGIVKKIKFGKYEKTHVCNLRKFKVFGGLEQENLVLLFEGGLKNDSVSETFNLKHTTDTGDLLPVMFIQIMPLLSWGPSFNFSIWYVELIGQDDPIFVRTSLRNYNTLREVEIVRLCLKHFRQQGYSQAFQALQEQTSVQLEQPMLSELHDILVNRGDFQKTEIFIERFIDDGLMDNYLANQDYTATWELQHTAASKSVELSDSKIIPQLDYPLRPGMRGGHQLIIDCERSLMYLFGGWDGSEDLNDLWLYNTQLKLWKLIHQKSDLHDGPSPRSCHKMVYDPVNSQIFTLGRYIEGTCRTRDRLKSDFFLYNTISKTWLQICDDTSQVGGPQLIYDHQMCIDVAKSTIYVFGGRILTPKNNDDLSNDHQYSGLFSYEIGTNTWTQILVDCGHPSASNPDVSSIKARVTHSMLFHHKHRKLYIFGGQRNKEYTRGLCAYDVDSGELAILNADTNSYETNNVPQSGFTQRATIDSEKDEIYVLSSLSKEKERRDLNINSFWLYSLRTNEWNIIYKNDHPTENCYTKNQTMCTEPCPRYAHQLVYDVVNKVHYLFGGNPGRNTAPSVRLDDFWILYLNKPTKEEMLRHCKYLIRRLEYEEITKKNPLQAVQYLQTKLYEIINHSDKNQLKEFHKLASLLFICDDFRTSDQSLMTLPLGRNTNNVDIISDCDCGNSTKPNQPNSELSDSNSMDSNPDKNSSHMCSNIASLLRINKTEEQFVEIKNRRCLLFNKLVEFLPETMVQPKSNLSDFVLI